MSEGLPSWVRADMPVVCVARSSLNGRTRTEYDTTPGERLTLSRANFQGGRWLVGLKERPDYCGYEWRCFKPAVADKTEAEDLAHFKPLLTPDRLDVLAHQLDEQWIGMPDLDYVPEV